MPLPYLLTRPQSPGACVRAAEGGVGRNECIVGYLLQDCSTNWSDVRYGAMRRGRPQAHQFQISCFNGKLLIFWRLKRFSGPHSKATCLPQLILNNCTKWPSVLAHKVATSSRQHNCTTAALMYALYGHKRRLDFNRHPVLYHHQPMYIGFPFQQPQHHVLHTFI